MGLFDTFNLGNLLGAFNQSRESESEKDLPIRVAICLDPETPEELIPAIREAFMPQTSHAVVTVTRLEPDVPVVTDPTTDVALVVCGGSTMLCHDAGLAWLKANVPTLMLGRSTVEVPGATLAGGGQVAERLCISDPKELIKNLGHWIVDHTDKDVAFATNFPFCRWAAANELIQAVAVSNAAVCVFDFMPGVVDFTLVTANEIKLALDLAAIYDEEISFARIPEIVTILSFGFVTRQLAMGLQRLVPALGWLFRGIAGYGGAMVTGHALVNHYLGRGVLGEGFEGVSEQLKEWKEIVQEKVETLTGEVVRLGPDATYRHPKPGEAAPSQGTPVAEDVEETQPVAPSGWVEIAPGGGVQAAGASA